MENTDYALLTLTEYTKLKSIAESKGEPTVIKRNHLSFLYAVETLLDAEETELQVKADNITLIAKLKTGNKIMESFTTKTIEDYYFHPNKFIREILNA